MNKIIKRDGRIFNFDAKKIEDAILKAFIEVDGEISDYAKAKAHNIAKYIQQLDKNLLSVEEIQDLVEKGLMSTRRKDVARAYVTYRNERNRIRKNTTDNQLQELLSGDSEYWSTENSNKNAKVANVQRDYMAGIVSVDLTKRFLLPQDIIEANDEGIIHFHDMDYYGMKAIHNCSLINLEDMLQNGTVINDVSIEKPHRFITACTIATQIITAVASSQYGGCTINLAHLAPFVRDSREYYINKYTSRGFTEEESKKWVEEDLSKEIADGVQTFNYQINSMSTTNGQAPFLSVFMYLNDTQEYKSELAMLIEEFLNQRILGMKNEVGVYITPAFPKLLYVLEEDNILKGGKYDYLTKLAVKCSAKRLVPDYISEKKMKELKGEVFGCMGKCKLQLI
jgi:ribonucleoside-triphosphate reductase